MLARSLREKVIVALLRMPGTERLVDRSLLIPIEDNGFDRLENRRNDFELIVDQTDKVGTRHIIELLETCAKRQKGTELGEHFRVLCDEVKRSVAPPPTPRTSPTRGAIYLRSGEVWKTGELPLDHHAEGNSASPALAWGNVPPQTRSLAVVMEVCDAPAGEPRYYWGQVGIQPGIDALPRDAGIYDPALERGPYGRPLSTDVSDLEAYPGVRSSDAHCLYTIRLYALADEVSPEVTTARELARWVESPGRALAVAELPAPVRSPYTNRTFLFDGHPIVGRLLGARSRTVFLGFLCVSLVTLDFPAWLTHIYSIPPDLWQRVHQTAHKNTGFYFQANWMFLFTLVIPSFYAGVAAFGVWLRRSAQRLCARFSGVIKSPQERPYIVFLHDELKRHASRVTAFAFAFALITTTIDTYSLFGAYCCGGDPLDEAKDWSIAFTLDLTSESRNLALVIVAYLAQAVAIFLIAFVTAKFFVFLRILSQTVRGRWEAEGYVFLASTKDPRRRMGLSPLGDSYNAYIALALAIVAFAGFSRLRLIGENSDGLVSYFAAVSRIASLDIQQIADLGRWSSMSRGMWTLLFCLALPAGVIIYFPLIHMRRYLRDFINKQYDALQIKIRHTPELEKDRLREELDLLQATETWPNGGRAARRLMFAWLTLFLTALYPPAPILLFAIMIAATPVVTLWRKTATSRAH